MLIFSSGRKIYDIEDFSAGRLLLLALGGIASAETLTIATVNNGDMI